MKKQRLYKNALSLLSITPLIAIIGGVYLLTKDDGNCYAIKYGLSVNSVIEVDAPHV